MGKFIKNILFRIFGYPIIILIIVPLIIIDAILGSETYKSFSDALDKKVEEWNIYID